MGLSMQVSALASYGGLLVLAGCTMSAPLAPSATSTSSASGQVALANPAALACVRVGGAHRVVRQGDGSEIGMCHLTSGVICESWAFFRGTCPSTEKGRD
jgi:putative hemolysin